MIASVAETDTDNLKFLPTCNDSLTMDSSIDLCWRRRQLVEGWRLWVTPRARRFRLGGSVTRSSGCEPLLGTACRGLAAAAGSQFLNFDQSCVISPEIMNVE